MKKINFKFFSSTSRLRRQISNLKIALAFIFCFSITTAFAADNITSKAALVMEASTGRILFAKNPNLKLPPASTAKLVTAMVVLDRTQMNDSVTIGQSVTMIQPRKEQKFRPGENATIKTLLYAALVESSNDAAFALAEAVAGSEQEFVDLMNEKVIAIGASGTRFTNTTGLPGKGQQITVHNLAKIMRHALKYPEIREIIATKTTEISTENGRTLFLENTNRLLWSEPGALGGKTGYTKAARHCLVYAGEKNNDAIIVALLGAPNRKTLWNETEKLLAKGFDVIASNEQPMIYFTKADYKNSVKKTMYRKNAKNTSNGTNSQNQKKSKKYKNTAKNKETKDSVDARIKANNRETLEKTRDAVKG